MIPIALIFPGQGAQKVGMGKEFYETSEESRAIFNLADKVIPGLKQVTFEGPVEKLTSTAFCQAGILTTSIAALKAFELHPKFKNVSVQFTAGLSLGEYSALAAGRALSFEDTVRLVERRGAFMEEATKLSAGKMAAIIGLDKPKIAEICQQTGAEVANFNSLQQIVITGEAAKVETAAQACRDAGAKNVVMLEVSGAFHSSLMRPAAQKFSQELERFKINEPVVPIVSNVHAKPSINPEEISKNLAQQITSSVQWVDSVLFMAKQGVGDFVEIGPGKVLAGLIRRIDANLKVHNIEKPEDIEKLPF